MSFSEAHSAAIDAEVARRMEKERARIARDAIWRANMDRLTVQLANLNAALTEAANAPIVPLYGEEWPVAAIEAGVMPIDPFYERTGQ